MKILKTITLLILIVLTVYYCTTVPITGRKQLNIIPAAQINSLSFQQYDEFLKSNNLSTDEKATAMVKKVGLNIKAAVERYFAEKNWSKQLEGYQWEFNLVESDEVNAWCMPGGKVVVYTGILPLTKDETGLAVVMGHEIAHAIAQHGSERMSQGLLQQLGGMALDVALQNEPAATRNLFLTAYGIGSTLGVILPYSRTHESEADRLGLIFMAMAGYDPNQSIDFWQRMADLNKAKVPEFLSTHPSDATRIADLRKHLPEALKYYNR
jgi:predicted Zn-dependent protease